MALIWMDGFDCYGTDQQDITGNMGSAGYVVYAGSVKADANTRSGLGYAMHLQAFSTNIVRNTAAVTEFFFGFAVNFDRFDNPGVEAFFSCQYDNSFGTNQQQLQLNVSDTGSISASNFGGLLGMSDPGVVQNNAWHWLEGHVVIDGTNGSIAIQIDGDDALTLTGLNLVNTNVPAKVNQFQFLSSYGNYEGQMFDDFYVCDTTGDSLNTWLGDNIVYGMLVNGDAGTNNMTQVGGGVGHFTTVNQIAPDGDTSYLTSNVPGTTELFTVPNLPANAINVLAVMVSVDARREAGGIAKVAPMISDGTHTITGAAQPVPNTYALRNVIFPTAPDGGAWSVAKVNTPLQIGAQVAA